MPSGSVSYTYTHAEIPAHTFQPSPEDQPFYLPKRADAAIGTASLQEVIFAGNKFRYAKESAQLLTEVARLNT